MRLKAFRPGWEMIRTVTLIGIPTAVIQICLSVASSLTNIAACAFGAKNELRFHRCVRFALKGSLMLTRFLGLTGIALTQPATDVLTLVVCLLSIRPMKRIASQNMART